VCCIGLASLNSSCLTAPARFASVPPAFDSWQYLYSFVPTASLPATPFRSWFWNSTVQDRFVAALYFNQTLVLEEEASLETAGDDSQSSDPALLQRYFVPDPASLDQALRALYNLTQDLSFAEQMQVSGGWEREHIAVGLMQHFAVWQDVSVPVALGGVQTLSLPFCIRFFDTACVSTLYLTPRTGALFLGASPPSACLQGGASALFSGSAVQLGCSYSLIAASLTDYSYAFGEGNDALPYNASAASFSVRYAVSDAGVVSIRYQSLPLPANITTLDSAAARNHTFQVTLFARSGRVLVQYEQMSDPAEWNACPGMTGASSGFGAGLMTVAEPKGTV
jgi:hypothetical protein